MSTSDLQIDPALRDPLPPPPPQTSKSRSPKKRKARGSGSNPTPSPGGRVTRRSAASALGNGNGNVDGASGEPSRGEEENLIKYAWRGDAKRPRRQSISKNTTQSDPPYLAGYNADSGPSNLVGSSTTGLGELALPLLDPSFRIKLQPYPIGLTPFRYPCLSPHKPPPPPGDPLAPAFQPFDPSAPDDPPAPPAAPLSVPELSNEFELPDPSDEAAYRSLSALLAASQSDPPDADTMAVYPQSPGERSDGQVGALSPRSKGKYTVGMKYDCEACRTGLEGHVGHWLRSHSDWDLLGNESPSNGMV